MNARLAAIFVTLCAAMALTGCGFVGSAVGTAFMVLR